MRPWENIICISGEYTIYLILYNIYPCINHPIHIYTCMPKSKTVDIIHFIIKPIAVKIKTNSLNVVHALYNITLQNLKKNTIQYYICFILYYISSVQQHLE